MLDAAVLRDASAQQSVMGIQQSKAARIPESTQHTGEVLEVGDENNANFSALGRRSNNREVAK
jgi:hypothetical protein